MHIRHNMTSIFEELMLSKTQVLLAAKSTCVSAHMQIEFSGSHSESEDV